MDELDRRILMYLEASGFQQSNILARFSGVSERTIRRRLNNIIQNKLVKVIAVPNFILFGFRAWARIGIKVLPGSLKSVASKLVDNPSIYYVAYALGRFDIILSVFFRTMDQLTYFVNSELTKIRGVQSIETMLLVSPRKYNLFSWPEPTHKDKNNNVLGIGNDASIWENPYDIYKIDEVDQKILENLMENGLMRPRSLASRLNIGENTIRRRLKDMLKNEVYKLEAQPLTDIWEYETQATIGININNQSPHRVIDIILENPAVFLAATSLGRFNIVIAARFPNTNLLNQFATTFLPSIPGITSTETFLHARRLKYRNFIWPIS